MPHAPDLSGLALDGRYELHAVIGEGTFGRVYRGRDRRLARPVAVKVIKPWWSEDPDWVRRFELEAQLLARLNDPGIVQIFDVGHANEGLYYVAELVDGESLAGRVGRRGPLPPDEAREIAVQLCRALARAHAQDVIHRDVKPANVLISSRGEVKVGDFGVAALAQGSTDGAGATVVGTPRYMAPEQARGGRTGPGTDVYGAGIVLYEMLAGHPPFLEGSPVELALRHLHDAPPPLPADTPAALAGAVERALAKRPEDRYRSAAAMADALESAQRDPAGVTPRIAARRAAERPEAATAVLERPDAPPATRVRAPTVPKREPAPKAKPRRKPRSRLALAAVAPGVALVIAVVAVGLIGGKNHVKVPSLRGENRAAATATLRHLGLKAAFHHRYSRARVGSTVAQTPRAGTKLVTGSTVRVTLSDGPPPVQLPQLVGKSGSEAQLLLTPLGLHTTLTPVPAPGVTPGIVTKQSTAAGADAPVGSTIALQVAEQPRWRPLTSFSGRAGGESVIFRILGSQWRIVYSMHYQGLCTLIFFCSGPNARVFHPGGATVGGLNLSTGSGQSRVFALGPGLYRIAVTPGSDSAAWSIEVEDYY